MRGSYLRQRAGYMVCCLLLRLCCVVCLLAGGREAAGASMQHILPCPVVARFAYHILHLAARFVLGLLAGGREAA
jgi:hypothetical protein